MENYSFKTKGVCSMEISFQADGDIIKNIKFKGGCSGNTKGVASLADGMKAQDLVDKLKGTDCNGRGTSCPDQLAQAIEKYVLNK